MKYLAYIVTILVSFSGLAQKDSLSWIKQVSIPLVQEANWTVDQYGNMYVWSHDLVQKYDKEGKKIYEQSIKKFGDITQIDARNPLKLLAFSEDQQSVFYLDNTLTLQANELDLSDAEKIGFQLNYVTKIASSSQMDKIWTFDQTNAKITLISSNKSQAIQLHNLTGLFDLATIESIVEWNERLYILGNTGKVLVLDLYGTYMQDFQTNLKSIEVMNGFVYGIAANELVFQSIQEAKVKKIPFPVPSVQKVKIIGKQVYFQANQELNVFSLDFF